MSQDEDIMREIREAGADGQGSEFGALFEAARAASGLSLYEVSRRSGIRMANLSKLRRGLYQPRVETLRRLGAVLGVPWHTLVAP